MVNPGCSGVGMRVCYSTTMSDLIISVAKGLKNSIVEREVSIPAGNVVAYAKALADIPPEVEAWWSTHTFKPQPGKGCKVIYAKGTSNERPCTELEEHRHRKQEFWAASSGIMLDLDLKCDGAKTKWADTDHTKALNARLNNLLVTASPPGKLSPEIKLGLIAAPVLASYSPTVVPT